MAAKEIVPALGLESFSCPHINCGAIAHQTWFKLFAHVHDKDARPWVPSEDDLKSLEDKFVKSLEDKFVPEALAVFRKLSEGKVFFETQEQYANLDTELMSVNASKCYSCGGISLWRADELIYPVNRISIAPNEGMPEDVKADFIEANEILDKSPRGAAALLALVYSEVDDSP